MLGTLLASAAALAPGPAEPPSDHVYRGSAGGTSLTIAGEPTWSARSVEVAVRPLSATAGSAGIVMHYLDDSQHYLFLLWR